MHGLLLEVQALSGEFMVMNQDITIKLPSTTSKLGVQGIEKFFTPQSPLDNKAVRLISVSMDNGQFVIKGRVRGRQGN